MAEQCPSCGQTIKEPHEGPTRKPRKKFVVSIPEGEEGVIDDLMIQFVERFQPKWEGEHEMLPVGARHWKYMALHHLLYAAVTAPDEVADRLLPSEIGG